MSIEQKPKPRKVNVLASSQELAELIRSDSSFIEKDVLNRGDELVGIYSDDSMRGTFKDFNKMKIEAIKLAIDDLSAGGITLRRSTIGLTFSNGKFLTFIEPFGSTPAGNVVFSINLKNLFSFKNWRSDDGVEISQDDINVAIYRLAVSWAQYLP